MFGPRIPNTEAHAACARYLEQQLKAFGAEVIGQDFTEKTFDGKTAQLRNIIGVINPKAKRRILLAAHWDTRPFADQDKKDPEKTFDGANDGASGVGILLEVARALQTADPKADIGVDIVFFDGEDYGENDAYTPTENEEPGKWWCLGAKYWAAHKHSPEYSAYFGILLDMVGNANAKFAREGVSLHYAPSVVDRVWGYAAALGYGSTFINTNAESITDDHVYVNRIGNINMIDIIEYDMSDGNYFSNTWHTHADNMEHIDKNTLKAVGQTLLQTLYEQQPEVLQ